MVQSEQHVIYRLMDGGEAQYDMDKAHTGKFV